MKKMILVFLGLIVVLAVREYQHAEQIKSLKYEIEDIKEKIQEEK